MNELSQDVIDALDPGIRQVVLLLRSWGFKTTDSGDGVTKVGIMECAMPIPHVVIPATRCTMHDVADRLYGKLGDLGCEVDLVDLVLPNVKIEATYDPADESAIVIVYGLDDELLARLRRG